MRMHSLIIRRVGLMASPTAAMAISMKTVACSQNITSLMHAASDCLQVKRTPFKFFPLRQNQSEFLKLNFCFLN